MPSILRYRRALETEMAKLNQFIHDSKQYWNYPAEFLSQFMSRWGLTDPFLRENTVMLAEQDNLVSGLYAFSQREGHVPELALFFIQVKRIRQGLGSILWQHALNHAQKQGWSAFELIADPHAEGFYHRMGATTIGHFESFPGRFVPIMTMKIDPR